MSGRYTLYGWELSFYSGKLRAYLRYKDIDFRERHPTLLGMRRIRKKVGAMVMPVLVTPGGEWLQDTSHIIDVLEARHPQAPVVPETPRQRLAASLLEAWGDEFWLAPAMHYRWNFPENFQQIFRPEGGDNLLPFAPRFVKNRVVTSGANAMRRLCPGLGVRPEQQDLIERWSEIHCDALEAHFAVHDYLLGGRPSLGDFGLIGPLYAHLGRDPYPRRTLIEPRPHLAAWIARMQQPVPCSGAFLPDDTVPESLAPLFASVFGEFWPQLQKTQALVAAAVADLAPGRGLPRSMDEISVPYANGTLRMHARPFSLWMAQRALDVYGNLDSPGRDSVDAWLETVGGTEMDRLRIQPRLDRLALRVAPAAVEG